MDIVYASNDKYARHLGVSIYSLLDCNQMTEEIRIYVLSVGMEEDSRKKIESITDWYGRELHVIGLNDLKERFSYQVDTGGFDISTLSRLWIGQLLPDDVERVIYLDCDTVVAGGIEKLWNTDLKGNVLGAVMEPTIYAAAKEEIGLGPGEPYYNAGVLLVDLKQWRREGVQEQLLEFYQSKGGRLFACDQDAINGVLRGRIRTISPRYNFFTNYRYFSYEELVRLSPVYGRIPKEVFLAARRHPAVIHYMGDERPWMAGNLNHYHKAYDTYLKLSPWRGSAREGGKRLYLLAYHVMEYLTAVCPRSRRLISRRYGMRLVNARRKSEELQAER